jgi:hypothetical protein
MHAIAPARMLTVAIVACAVLAGCAAGATITEAPAPTPVVQQPTAATSAPTTAPSTPGALTPRPATPAPSPVRWGDAVLVHGTEACTVEHLLLSPPDPTGTARVRDAAAICQMDFDDRRVSGVKTGPFGFDGWGTLGNGAFVQWGAPRTITNDGGTWVGWFTGAYASPTGDMITAWYEGAGAYEGLSFYEWIAGSGSGSYDVTGLIFPGAPPAAASSLAGPATGRPVDPPTSSAPTTAPGRALPEPLSWGDAVYVQGWEICNPINDGLPSPDPHGVSRLRGASLDCKLEFNDPRLNGTRTGPYAGDAWGSAADGAMVVWSPDQRIENAGGAWVGTMSGVVTSPAGEMIAAWFEGTGAYEGLSFFEWIGVPGGADPSGHAVTGLIFPGKPPVPRQ